MVLSLASCMQPMAAYVNQKTRRTEPAPILGGFNELIQGSSACESKQRNDEYHIPMVDRGWILQTVIPEHTVCFGGRASSLPRLARRRITRLGIRGILLVTHG